MRLFQICFLFLIVILTFSCRTGITVSSGLTYDRGTIFTGSNPDQRDVAHGPGAFLDVGIKRIIAYEDRRTDFIHGFGLNYKMHLNGYIFNEGGDNIFYKLFQAKGFWELESLSSNFVTTYLYGGIGAGEIKNTDGGFLLAPTFGMDIHLFRREFIFISPNVSYIQNFNIPGSQLSFGLGLGFYFK